MQKEDLFAWPICMYTYAPGEGNDWQFPFPNYENGDIFLSWGAVGVDAYAAYKPDLALKYIENILARYEKDGLAFQRYGRAKQDGLGDDILSGNSLALVGLYKSIYGINPKYNRLYLDPHLPEKLSGTTLNYYFQGRQLKIELAKSGYSISNGLFRIKSSKDFGFNVSDNYLEYFDRNNDRSSLTAHLSGSGDLEISIRNWGEDERSWEQTTSLPNGKVKYKLYGFKPSGSYRIIIDGRNTKTVVSNKEGNLEFSAPASKKTLAIVVRKVN
jgi:hypothetical protein